MLQTPPRLLIDQLAAVMKHMAQPDTTFKAQGEARMTPVYYATVHIQSAEVRMPLLQIWIRTAAATCCTINTLYVGQLGNVVQLLHKIVSTRVT